MFTKEGPREELNSHPAVVTTHADRMQNQIAKRKKKNLELFFQETLMEMSFLVIIMAIHQQQSLIAKLI